MTRSALGTVCALLISVILPLLAAQPASAEVRVVRRPDGSTYVYNIRTRGVTKPPQAGFPKPTQQREVIEALVQRHARRASLEPELVLAVIQAESAFDPRARSHKGAMGLMQLMPETAKVYAVSDPFDPDQNVGAGTQYLKRLIDSTGGLELGLAAYNAGPGAVQRFGGVPPYPETRGYVEKVMRLYRGDEQFSLSDTKLLRPGRKTYLLRDASGRLVMTTSPPAK